MEGCVTTVAKLIDPLPRPVMLLLIPQIFFFLLLINQSVSWRGVSRSSLLRHAMVMTSSGSAVTIMVPIILGESVIPTGVKLQPIFAKSEFYTKTYKMPFNINIEKPPKGFPAPVVNKDTNAADGERIGDVLRATTAWAQNFNGGGALKDITQFAGVIKWRNCVFDTYGAPWDEVIKALMSNNGKSEEVTLIFERPLADDTNEHEND